MEDMKKYKAFTLAEVLITLAIIGVVAALTIPSTIANFNDKKFNTARLKALHTFGYSARMASINGEINSQTNAKNFVNNVLSKRLKITRICDTADACDFPSQIQPSKLDDNKLNMSNLNRWSDLGDSDTNVESPIGDASMSTYIMTADGFTAKVFYNPKCARDSREVTFEERCVFKECAYYSVDAACVNVIYDMNGLRGPNHIGEDIGIVTTFWSGYRSISITPGIIPYSVNTSGTLEAVFGDAPKVCAQKGTVKIPYTMPNVYELLSIKINKNLTCLPDDRFWTGSIVADRPGTAWRVDSDGSCRQIITSKEQRAWCVRR